MNVFCAGDTASGVTLPRSLRDAAVALLLLPVWRMGAAQTGQCDISTTSLLHGRSGPARMSAVGRRPGHGRGQHKGGASTMRPVRLVASSETTTGAKHCAGSRAAAIKRSRTCRDRNLERPSTSAVSRDAMQRVRGEPLPAQTSPSGGTVEPSSCATGEPLPAQTSPSGGTVEPSSCATGEPRFPAGVEVPGGPARAPRRGWRLAARWGPQAPCDLAASPPPTTASIPRRCPGPPSFPSGGPRQHGRRQGRAATEELAPAPTGATSSLATDHAARGLSARPQSRTPTAPRIPRGAMDPTPGQGPFQHGNAHDEADAPEEAWLRTGQVAALFRVHRRTVLRWAAAGLLPHVVTLGGQRRFPKAGVHALLARRRGQVPEEPGGLLRTGEVAGRLRVNPRTVTRWRRQGRLASLRTLGGHHRYPQAAVDRLLSQPGDPPPPGPAGKNDDGAAGTAAEMATPLQAGPESARPQEP